MFVLNKIISKYSRNKKLDGLDIGICLHITKETSVLVMGLKEAGAIVSLCSANPRSTKKEIKDFLIDSDIKVFTEHNDDLKSFYTNMDRVLDSKPQIITDDGGELHKKAIFRGDQIDGGTEETTSGINRLKSLDKIPYPIIAVNDSTTKQLLDNKFGTGQSTIEGIIKTTGVLLASKRIVVCGYGAVGKGVSRCARGMGAKVTITEINPIRALEAYFDGYEVAQLDKLLPHNDIFITCTGQINVIGKKHFKYLKDGVILCNAGHFDVEIDVKSLDDLDPHHYDPLESVTCYHLGKGKLKKKVNLLSGGRVVNLVSAEGNSPEVMDISFANQFLSIIYVSEFKNRLPKKVLNPPFRIQQQIARLTLESFGLDIDLLTQEQKGYYKI